jgi:SAM-dependent methyltransferase
MAETNPAAAVVGLELSACVDEAAAHARRRGVRNVRFVQADLMAPPFPDQTFDFILSEGVLHHTPDTRAAFHSLARLLAPGGEIGVYVYRKKAPLREFADDHVRQGLQRLSPDEAWTLMEPLTRLGRALSELEAEVDVPEDVEVLGIKAGRYDVQRLVYYAMFKCYWNPRLTFDENVHVNFDWYYPRYSWRHTEEELRRWTEEAGLEVSHEAVEASGITLRARRRPSRP